MPAAGSEGFSHPPVAMENLLGASILPASYSAGMRSKLNGPHLLQAGVSAASSFKCESSENGEIDLKEQNAQSKPLSATHLPMATRGGGGRLQQLDGRSDADSSSGIRQVAASPMQGGKGCHDEDDVQLSGGVPEPPLPDGDQPAVPEQHHPRSLLILLLALLLASLALSLALPFTKKGDLTAILLGLVVIGGAALPLLYPQRLLAMAALLSLSYSPDSSEQHFKLSFHDSRLNNDMQASITLGTCHFIMMLRSLMYDCSSLFGAGFTHSIYFGIHVLPTFLLIVNRIWYVRHREHVLMAVRVVSEVLTIAWMSGALPQCHSPHDHMTALAVIAVAVHRALVLQVRLEQQLKLAPLETAAVLLTAYYNGNAMLLQDRLKLTMTAAVLPALTVWAAEKLNRARYEFCLRNHVFAEEIAFPCTLDGNVSAKLKEA